MDWKENPQMADRILSVLADTQLGEASEKPLPHSTELIYCLTRSYMEHFEPLPRDPKTSMMFLVGVGLGEALLKPPLRVEVPIVKDGIHCSLDFQFDGHFGELKSTRQSTRRPPEEFSVGWHRQLKSYMSATECLSMVYSVIYVQPAIMKAWEVTAQQGEIDELWTWMLARKVVYMDHVERQERPPPFVSNEPWECGYCQYRLVCEADPRNTPDVVSN